MPELPEVEIVQQSLSKNIKGKKINRVLVKNRNLRFKIPSNFITFLKDKKIINVFNKCDLNSDLSNIKIKYKKNLVKSSALTPNGIKDLKNYIENLAENKFTKVLFHLPINSNKISSWLHKNSYVYNETFCDIDFVGNKIKAKISNDKLNSFSVFIFVDKIFRFLKPVSFLQRKVSRDLWFNFEIKSTSNPIIG